MNLHSAGAVAGTVSTIVFVASYLPMLHKAWRTRDLSSYSVGNLAVANLGNAVHTIYVVSLPMGPIWALHGFYLFATALMMCCWLRYRNQHTQGAGRPRRDGTRSPVPHWAEALHDTGGPPGPSSGRRRRPAPVPRWPRPRDTWTGPS